MDDLELSSIIKELNTPPTRAPLWQHIIGGIITKDPLAVFKMEQEQRRQRREDLQFRILLKKLMDEERRRKTTLGDYMTQPMSMRPGFYETEEGEKQTPFSFPQPSGPPQLDLQKIPISEIETIKPVLPWLLPKEEKEEDLHFVHEQEGLFGIGKKTGKAKKIEGVPGKTTTPKEADRIMHKREGDSIITIKVRESEIPEYQKLGWKVGELKPMPITDDKLEKRARTLYGVSFRELSPDQQEEVRSSVKEKETKESYDLIEKIGDPTQQKYIVKGTEIPKGWRVVKAPAAEVKIDIGGKALTKIGEKMGETIIKEYEDAKQARASLERLKQAKVLINSEIITGFGANYILEFGKALQKLGFQYHSQPIANTEAFVSLMGNQVGQIIKQFGAGTGLSDADREYAEKIAAGKITLTKESIKKIIDLNEKGLKNIIRNYNKKAIEVMKKPGAEELPFNLIINEPIELTKNDPLGIR